MLTAREESGDEAPRLNEYIEEFVISLREGRSELVVVLSSSVASTLGLVSTLGSSNESVEGGEPFSDMSLKLGDPSIGA